MLVISMSSSSRQRDVLPLPSFETHSFAAADVSAQAGRRLRRKNKILAWANSGVAVSNSLGCGGSVSHSHQPSSTSKSIPIAAQII